MGVWGCGVCVCSVVVEHKGRTGCLLITPGMECTIKVGHSRPRPPTAGRHGHGRHHPHRTRHEVHASAAGRSTLVHGSDGGGAVGNDQLAGVCGWHCNLLTVHSAPLLQCTLPL